jgi:hypothetical protein
MFSFLLLSTVDINFTFPHLKLLTFALLLEVLETFLSTVGSSRENYPSSRCTPATNAVCKDVNIFSKVWLHLNVF